MNGLTNVGTASLQRLLEAVRAGRLNEPVTGLALESFGVREAAALVGASRATVEIVVLAVLAERAASVSPPQLVWTGPDARASAARDSAVVLQELFGAARRSVLIAGFRFDHGASLLQALHSTMSTYGVTCRVFADSEDGQVDFVRANWPFGPPFPRVYTYRTPAGVYSSLHAKCVVVDSSRVLITSANFTDRGQTRNIEVGVLLDDAALATELEEQFQHALTSGAFVEP